MERLDFHALANFKTTRLSQALPRVALGSHGLFGGVTLKSKERRGFVMVKVG
jgi:hypothetical protein